MAQALIRTECLGIPPLNLGIRPAMSTGMTTEDSTREDYVKGLREVADFIEAHPDAPLPVTTMHDAFVHDKSVLAVVAKVCGGRWEKRAGDSYFYMRKMFSGGHHYDVNISRASVCRKVATGTIIRPAEPECEVETYHWVCDEPLLMAAV